MASKKTKAVDKHDDAPVKIEPVKTADVPVEEIADFIARHEMAAQRAGTVVAIVTFPGESVRVYPGTYSGIRVSDGKPSAIYSDGTKH